MTDSIFIKGLTLHAYHGVMSHEAKVGQTFAIDIALDIDLSDAARSDKVADTVSYDQVVTRATEAFLGHRFRLIEAAAGSVAETILSAFPRVEKVAVTIHKPHAPVAATFSDVGVRIVRARSPRK
jgi:dihydroneopterin aldolase